MLAALKERKLKEKAEALATKLGLPFINETSDTSKYPILIEVTNRGLRARGTKEPIRGTSKIEFGEGEMLYRSKRGRNARSPLAQAVGIKPERAGKLRVVDCTGGLYPIVPHLWLL